MIQKNENTNKRFQKTTLIQHNFVDEKTQFEQELNYNLTTHGKKRSEQRGISTEQLFLITEYGELFQKQGLLFYAVPAKNLPKKLNGGLKQKLNDMVVVIDPSDNTIITCYKSKNAMKHIKKKQKRLGKAA